MSAGALTEGSVIPGGSAGDPADGAAIPIQAADPTLKLVSVLMQYPTVALFEGLPLLAELTLQTPRKVREHVSTFVQWLGYTSPDDVARHYVNTFDLRKRCALYLTYYRYGDTRNRGMALIEFKNAYRTAGFTPDEYELPDYLPMVLDFAALYERGQRLLHGHRSDLELLRRALEDAQHVAADRGECGVVEERRPPLQRPLLLQLGGPGRPAELVVAPAPDVADDEDRQRGVGQHDPDQDLPGGRVTHGNSSLGKTPASIRWRACHSR
jgi:nitrate reductase delta subunit